MSASELHENVTTLLRQLEGDLENEGWDQPARLYVIEAVEDDPYAIMITDCDGHPCDLLDILPPLTNQVAKGVILAYEGWAVEVDKEKVKEVYALLEMLGMSKDMQDHIASEVMGRMAPQPSKSEQRIECRFVTAMMRDGTSRTVRRRRGHEQDGEVMTETAGRIDSSLRRVICVEAW